MDKKKMSIFENSNDFVAKTRTFCLLHHVGKKSKKNQLCRPT